MVDELVVPCVQDPLFLELLEILFGIEWMKLTKYSIVPSFFYFLFIIS